MKNSIYILLLGPILGLFMACQSGQEKPGGYQTIDIKTPKGNGTEDYITADYESRDRTVWQKPEIVISRLGDLTNKTVVDLGAGSGFFAFRVLPNAKKVIALDIDQRFITFMDSLKQELDKPLRDKFITRLVAPNDAKLQAKEADAVIIVNTYMFIENRVEYMKNLRKGMSSGAVVLIVDFKEKNLPVGPPTNLKIPLSTVERELQQAGFKVKQADDTSLDYQYIITAINP